MTIWICQIIGVGGISDWRDAMEYIMAGASDADATAIATRGLGVFSRDDQGDEMYMRGAGCHDLRELVGVAHETLIWWSR